MDSRFSLVCRKDGEIRARDTVSFLRAWGSAPTNGLNQKHRTLLGIGLKGGQVNAGSAMGKEDGWNVIM